MSMLDRVKKALGGESEAEKAAASGAGPSGAVSPARHERYLAAVEAQRAEKDHYFSSDPYAPLSPDDQEHFEGLAYYPPDPLYQFALTLERGDPESLVFQTSTGDEQLYHRVGVVRFEIEGEPARLAVYESVEHGELFLPFRDATSGKETYGAGRYLEPIDLGDDQLLVDFNLAYNPYCAYSPDFSCPLPPVENWLQVPVRAGEKSYKVEG